MPGFFESLKRMAAGKPVFDANDDNKGWVGNDGKPREVSESSQSPQQVQSHPEAPETGVVKGNASTYPVVYVKRTRTQLSGNNQTVYINILNSSRVEIELHEMNILGSRHHLNERLRPGEEREFMIFNGPRRTSEGPHEATIDYKIEQTGDYFQSLHDVEYQYEQDKTYSVEELHLRLPIRDIYG